MGAVRRILVREPVLVRNLVVAVLAVVASLVPDLDVGTVEAVVMGGLVLLFGVDARGKVTPVADPKL